jgi:hypothetical protein
MELKKSAGRRRSHDSVVILITVKTTDEMFCADRVMLLCH